MLRRPILDRLRGQPLPPRGTGRLIGTARPRPALTDEERRARHYGSICKPCGLLGSLFFGQLPEPVEVYRGIQIWSKSSMGETSYYCDLSPLWFDTVQEVRDYIDSQLGEEEEYVSTLSITIVNPQYGDITMLNAPHAVQIDEDLYGFTAPDNIRISISPAPNYEVGKVYLDGVQYAVPESGGTLTILMTTSHYLLINLGVYGNEFLETYRGYDIYITPNNYYEAYLNNRLQKTSSSLIVLKGWIDDQVGGGDENGGNGGTAPFEIVIPLVDRAQLEATQVHTEINKELNPLYINMDKCTGARIQYKIEFLRGATLATYVYAHLKVQDIEVMRRRVNKFETINGSVDITNEMDAKTLIKYGFESAAGLWELLEFTLEAVLSFEEDPGWGGGLCPFPKLRPGLVTSGDAPVLCSLWLTTVSTIPVIQKVPVGPVRKAWNNIDIDIDVGKAKESLT